MVLQELSQWEIFYWLCGISFAVIVAVYLLGIGGRRSGMQLKMRSSAREPLRGPGEGPDPLPTTMPVNYAEPAPRFKTQPPPSYPPPRSTGFKPMATERPLNVMFNYNGESWDAYEVLGLPAGSSLEKADAAFKKASSSVDPSSRGFIEAAHRAISEQWRTYQKASGQ